MANITIGIKLPVINGYVSIPDDNISLPRLSVAEVLAGISGTSVLTFGVHKKRKFVLFPTYDSQGAAAADYYTQLRALAHAKI